MKKEDQFAELAWIESDLTDLEREVRDPDAPAVVGAPAQNWQELYLRLDEPVPGQPTMRLSDQCAALAIGVAGGLLDLAPTIADSLTSEETHQRLDKIFKTKVKEVTGQDGVVAIDNVKGGGPSHRMVGPTHDIGRLFEAIRCVRNGEFRSRVSGHEFVTDRYGPRNDPYLKVDSPIDALMLLLLHWASDFFSKQSLPLPGWSKLAEEDDRVFVSSLFRAYRDGLNLRTALSQLLSNLSGVALISVLLHIYRYIDMIWITERRMPSLSDLSLRNDLRFRWMSRNATFTAAATAAGHAAVTHNFFALNYVAAMRFVSHGLATERILNARHAELDLEMDQIIRELGGS